MPRARSSFFRKATVYSLSFRIESRAMPEQLRPSPRPSLGVALIALNSAARLAQCLEAVAFADEIVVIDGGSTDDTAAIAGAHRARVIVEREWPGFGPQKN